MFFFIDEFDEIRLKDFDLLYGTLQAMIKNIKKYIKKLPYFSISNFQHKNCIKNNSIQILINHELSGLFIYIFYSTFGCFFQHFYQALIQ